MLIPKLEYLFCYSCSGKYLKKDLIRIIKHIKINYITGCWEYTGYLDKDGYGQFDICRKGKRIHISAHRAAYEMSNNKLIPEGLCVLHKCDNPKCVNVIKCLFCGTHQDNTQDMIKKRRRVCTVGDNNGMSKLTWTRVAEIRRLWLTGKYTRRQLADKSNIDITIISRIIQNKRWIDKNYTSQ